MPNPFPAAEAKRLVELMGMPQDQRPAGWLEEVTHLQDLMDAWKSDDTPPSPPNDNPTTRH